MCHDENFVNDLSNLGFELGEGIEIIMIGHLEDFTIGSPCFHWIRNGEPIPESRRGASKARACGHILYGRLVNTGYCLVFRPEVMRGTDRSDEGLDLLVRKLASLAQ